MKHVPNLISAARIIMIPFFCITFLNDQLLAALIILAVSVGMRISGIDGGTEMLMIDNLNNFLLRYGGVLINGC